MLRLAIVVAGIVVALPLGSAAAGWTVAGWQGAVAAASLVLLPYCALLWYCLSSKLDEATLRADIAAIQQAFGSLYDEELRKDFGTESVRSYYTATTDRDYKLLEAFIGGGLHSRLVAPAPAGSSGSGTRQPGFVLAEARAVGAKRVLEVGSGRGYCSLFLAGAAPDIKFEGVDLVPRHIEVASTAAASAGLSNASFRLEDATKLDASSEGAYDLIFSVEALCHMDTPAAVTSLARAVSRLLRPGGRLVIVDGFRSEGFSVASTDAQTAMCLAESGFRIRAMPSRRDWVEACAAHGMRVVRDQDLTHEALPFWRMGWRVARALLLAPWLVRAFVTSSAERRETGANFLSVATTAHAMRDRASAEYALLVIERPLL